MANNYFEFANEFRFPEDVAREYMNILSKWNEDDLDELPDYIKSRLFDFLEIDANLPEAEKIGQASQQLAENQECLVSDVCVEYFEDSGKMYMGSADDAEYADPEMALKILSWVMKENNIETPVKISGCYYCSKPRPDEFGGVAYAVGPDIVKAAGTDYLCDKLADEIRKELKKSQDRKPADKGRPFAAR